MKHTNMRPGDAEDGHLPWGHAVRPHPQKSDYRLTNKCVFLASSYTFNTSNLTLLNIITGGGVQLKVLVVATSVGVPSLRSCRPDLLRGWRNTVGNLIEICWGSKKAYRRPCVIGICVKNRGVRFHRIRDFKQYYFSSTPPISHLL